MTALRKASGLVSHCVIHGGNRVPSAVVIGDHVIAALRALYEPGPPYNLPAIHAIWARRCLRSSTRQPALTTFASLAPPGGEAPTAVPHALELMPV